MSKEKDGSCMGNLSVKRFNIVTVHRNGETYDDIRERPNGEFCRYREANFSHLEIINEKNIAREETLNLLGKCLEHINDDNLYLEVESIVMSYSNE